MNGEFNGFVINSDDENGCPENVLIQRGVFLNYNTEQLTIKSVKNLVVDNNMLDQSALYCITMNPVYKGIDNVTIRKTTLPHPTGLASLQTQQQFLWTAQRIPR